MHAFFLFQVQDLVPILLEFHLVDSGSFLPFIQVILTLSPILLNIYNITQLDVMHIFSKHTLNSIMQIINENVK